MNENQKTVVILGASKKADRYAYKAFNLLQEKGYPTIPINPALDEINGVKVKHSLKEIDISVDTVTIYMRPERWETQIEEIIGLKPQRVVLNPGTESEELEQKLKEITSDASIKIEDKVVELKADLLEYINSKVNKSSKLQDIIDYVEPFKKTATNKIKRYLYNAEDVKK